MVTSKTFRKVVPLFHFFQTFCNFPFVRLYLRNYDARLFEVDAIVLVPVVINYVTFTTRRSLGLLHSNVTVTSVSLQIALLLYL